uniref:phosphatase PAP2 family protein n=1 Tax=Desulforadius tongensis TaxID=1216062 RepID=UPI00195AAC30|nr:phosphatase PAP2 family protein [Desulforadius tongensis]
MLSIPVSNIFYALLNNSARGAHSMITEIDKAIPFLKIFILPYIIWYPFIFFTLFYLCLRDKKIYFHTLAALNLGLIICYIIYYTYQTTVPRPEVAGKDLLALLVMYIYSSDQPFNCFPSIHCLTSFLMIKGINNSTVKNTFNTTIISFTAAVIILSTLFVKQHVILDVISAILLGDLVFRLVHYFPTSAVLLWLRNSYPLATMKKKLEIYMDI